MRARRLGGIVLAVLALHGLLLDRALDAWRPAAAPTPHARPAALQLRPLTLQAVAVAEPAAAGATATSRPARPSASERSSPAAVKPRGWPPDSNRTGSQLPAATEMAREAASLEPEAVAAASAGEPAAAPALRADADLPIYATRLPPAFAFSYRLQRGEAAGSGELRWEPRDADYQARLTGATSGGPVQEWRSSGGFDAAGLAPTRYTDRRQGRGAQAANFRRETRKVTFSGPSVEHALPAGAQDRLSWMLQLAAIAAADPLLAGPGGRVTFLVVGARGEADVWTFMHSGEEVLALPGGSTPTLRLLREPRRPYDTRAEVWLDPARHYLPVQVRLSNATERDTLHLVLREVLPSPP